MGFFTWFHRRTTVEQQWDALESVTIQRRLRALEQACKRLYIQRRVTLEALVNLQGQIVQLERTRKKKR